MLVIGLMSGTSLDGIDACLVELHGVGRHVRHQVLRFETFPWPAGLREQLVRQLDPEAARLPALAALHYELAEAFAAAALRCADGRTVDLIGSHGHTLWHGPGMTLQLGSPSLIAARTGVTTVGDFRAADVAHGGQGAPLVPYADRLLFGHRPGPIALQNLGGIGNVTWLGDTLLAFDTGPGNMVMDGLMERLTGATFDRDGALARQGTVNDALLAWLKADDEAYMATPPPKSTGRERYGAPYVEALVAKGRDLGLGDADLVATATAFTAYTVIDQYRRWLPGAPREVIVSGGGTRNPVLMEALQRELPVITTADAGVDPDAKEALAFALLAYQCVMGEINVEIGATGAREAAVLGQIAPGRNFARVVLRQAAAADVVTEGVNPESVGLDALPTEAMVAVMHAQDYAAVQAVEGAQGAIAAAVDDIAARLADGGRLFYVGAGTSGRLGVLDASECPPTFSSDPATVQGLMAGGDRALREAVEGAEDDRAAGAADLLARGLGPKDYVVGISANGGAPYVQGALAAAQQAGAGTGLITCNGVRPGLVQPDHAIVLPVGPEVLAGSTRLKAGTATKLALNMLSTLAMVRLGKVHDNLMVDVRISNRKLQARAERLVGRLTGLAAEPAATLLAAAGGSVKRAAVMHHAGVDAAKADALLAESRGFLRPWLGMKPS
ncbi:MAG: Multifunctional fusion protein [Cyanobacteria bacterium RYN_339]|nr:Multifunctional fusion protein [Cyanobacteria bacterium RYN_339]